MKAFWIWTEGGSIILILSDSLKETEKNMRLIGGPQRKKSVSLSYVFLDKSVETDRCQP